jgi:hypothetical protein
LLRFIENIEKLGQMLAQVGAVFRRFVFDIQPEGFALENAGIFREEAKENSDQKPLQIVPPVAAVFE